MFDKIEILSMAQSMATHAAERQNVVAQNMANADTPGYRARDLRAFADVYQQAAEPLRATRPGHLSPVQAAFDPKSIHRTDPGTMSPNGNSVSLEDEMVKATAVKRDHDLALAIFKSSMGILRTGLGRGR